MALQIKQMPVSGNKKIGLCGNSGGDDVVVFGISRDHQRTRYRCYQFNGIDVLGQYLVGSAPNQA